MPCSSRGEDDFYDLMQRESFAFRKLYDHHIEMERHLEDLWNFVKEQCLLGRIGILDAPKKPDGVDIIELCQPKTAKERKEIEAILSAKRLIKAIGG